VRLRHKIKKKKKQKKGVVCCASVRVNAAMLKCLFKYESELFTSLCGLTMIQSTVCLRMCMK